MGAAKCMTFRNFPNLQLDQKSQLAKLSVLLIGGL